MGNGEWGMAADLNVKVLGGQLLELGVDVPGASLVRDQDDGLGRGEDVERVDEQRHGLLGVDDVRPDNEIKGRTVLLGDVYVRAAHDTQHATRTRERFSNTKTSDGPKEKRRTFGR